MNVDEIQILLAIIEFGGVTTIPKFPLATERFPQWEIGRSHPAG